VRDALAEAQAALVQKGTTLAEAQAQFLQDRIEGVRSRQTQVEQKTHEVEKLGAAL
jgi:hypothetical protein